jgi:hypothetical protein
MDIFTPYKKSITTKATNKLFFVHVWFHFGIPWTMILERDSRFFVSFWSKLWFLMETKLTK